jgi:hypothetical protein
LNSWRQESWKKSNLLISKKIWCNASCQPCDDL